MTRKTFNADKVAKTTLCLSRNYDTILIMAQIHNNPSLKRMYILLALGFWETYAFQCEFI